jgi:hypothetical protein
MENKTLVNQANEIVDKLNVFPLDMVEIEITQSLFSSKLTSINNEAIEKIVNTCLHHIKSHLGNDYENIDVIAYRIDIETSEFFSMDYIHHKLILIGNGFINKIATLKESLNSYVSNKLGDELSIKTSEKQQRDEIYSYLINQTTSSIRGDKFDDLSDKTNEFYHPELYDFSSKGWLILDTKEFKS